MIAIICEVRIAEGQRDAYLDHAARLLPELEGMDGFLSIERFESLATPGKLLSLSFWRDEAAVAAWRNHPEHPLAQAPGRAGIFQASLLRAGRVVRDDGPVDRAEAPADALER